ncbi:MAG: (d)CMP kinase [Defluviitaleaceae bacterium]|nr:(d)CMP kinase [Defluviitaleaceae bacterium]
MTSIRGATTVTENTTEAILEASGELLTEIIKANDLNTDQIIDITFSATKDINAVYPAVAARKMGIVEAGLFCVQEMDVPGSLPMCLRIMMHAAQPGRNQLDMNHVYLRGAEALRPDLAKKKALIAVAIDGPSGSGKSTVAKAVATASGIIYVDTGAMYRAVALYNIRKGVEPGQQAAVEESLSDISIELRYDSQKQQRAFLNGEDVTEALRVQRVAEGASVVASYQAVREKLVALQQVMARKHSVIMDGRDIATHVLPDAQVKIYLDASLEERTRRRMHELSQKGEPAVYEDVYKEIEIRDHRDMNRTHAPLVRTKEAVYIQSDGLAVKEIAEKIFEEMAKAR